MANSMRWRFDATLAVLAMGAACAGCSNGNGTTTGAPADGGSGADASDSGILVTARPYTLKVPTAYDATKPTPLVILLHGYGASGAVQDLYFDMTPAADAKTFLYAYADGTVDKGGKKYWNATDACCDFDGTPVDDVAYLTSVMDDVAAHYNVDPKRIFVVGHSNGGFMAHRLACEVPRVAAIVSLAGDMWEDASKCNPSAPVSVLQVHGDADDTIQYDGGTTAGSAQGGGGVYPSAHQTVATWASKDHCTGALTDTGETLSIDTSQPAGKTRVEKYAGCPTGIDVELWTMQGSGHVPALDAVWGDQILTFLSAHPKP